MMWFTWEAKHDPAGVVQEDLIAYDNAMRELFVDLVGSRIVVAALNEDIHMAISPMIERLYDLDMDIAKAKAEYRNSVEASCSALAHCYDQAFKFG